MAKKPKGAKGGKGVEIDGLAETHAALAAVVRQAEKDDEGFVVVGYTMPYALHVHERTDIPHSPGKAKYLEDPARDLLNSGELKSTVERAKLAGAGLLQSLFVGGLLVQRNSQLEVPVDTGALRSSAFVKIEKTA